MDMEASDDGVLTHDETTLLLPHKPKANWASIGRNVIALTAYGYVLITFFGMSDLKDCEELNYDKALQLGAAAGITAGLALGERIIPIAKKVGAWTRARQEYYRSFAAQEDQD